MDKTILISIPVEDLQTLIVDSVRECLKFHDSSIKKDEGKSEPELFGISEAAVLLGLKVPTLYSMTSKRILPHCKKGKRLYFDKKELLKWVNEGKRKTIADLENEIPARTSKKTNGKGK